MKKKVTLREFFTTIVSGLRLAVCRVSRIFDPRHKTKFWRVIWSIWTAVLVLFVGACCYIYWDKELRSFEVEDGRFWLSDNLYFQQVYNSDSYFFNIKENKKVLKGVYCYCCPAEGDSLAMFYSKDNKCGYFNINSGEIVLPAVYEKAWIFSDGVAMAVKDGTLHLITGKGESLATFWYSRKVQSDKEIDYVFQGWSVYCKHRGQEIRSYRQKRHMGCTCGV